MAPEADCTAAEIPMEFSYNFWLSGPTSSTLLTCCLPNGIVILLTSSHTATFAEIKEDLWYEAQKKPLFGALHDMSVYVFMYVNSMSEMEEINDESRRLCDVRPTGAVLKITECVGEKADHLNVHITHLIGKRLQEFDALSSPEINDFRFKMRRLGDDSVRDIKRKPWLDRLCYQHPPKVALIDETTNEAVTTVDKLGKLMIQSKIYDTEGSFKFIVETTITPINLVETILSKKGNRLKLTVSKSYVLKVYGKDEYLVGKCTLIDFQYIQDCIVNETTPSLIAIPIDKIALSREPDYAMVNNTDKKSSSTLTLRKKGKADSSWSIEEHFNLKIGKVNGINCDAKRDVEIGVQAGLFHGGKPLCESQKSAEKSITESLDCNVDETLTFDIKVCDIPRNAKLCFAIYEVSKNSKVPKNKRFREASNRDFFCNPILWANTSVYDFKDQLKTGDMSLYMWTYAEDILQMMSDSILHRLGTVVNNPNTTRATALTITFDNYSKETILFPTIGTLLAEAEKYHMDQKVEDATTLYNLSINGSDIERLISDCDTINDMHDQDRKRLWTVRRFLRDKYPHALPKLLHCIDWDDRKAVCEMVYMLQTWPLLPVEKSLELLDYAYADEEVRKYAVKCLINVGDDDLLLYLLQLVQALKHELYLDCDLVKFLLKRALKNQMIGHYLFWHLRSEMQVPSVSVRFGLILEAYCRGSEEHMGILHKQLECLERLKKSSELVRLRSKEKAKAALQDSLEETNESECAKNVVSPLDPSYRYTRIRIEKCRVMDSKMRPLFVVFENVDKDAEDIYIIFKNGDDLRQDMLTLQMIRIMDRLWKKEKLDLRMSPYKCISMEHRIGMIEVVLNAETIANIQKEKGMFSATSAFRKGSILAWLKDHNVGTFALQRAINAFTLSCAGYCVATYVLGVADRHSDNIMITKSGQLFHIDFGHILGHFKEKFGFKRERVPFVLTHDFVHVISKGQKNNLEFQVFQQYCEKAFLILRKHGGLILSLFAMMISTGLPELTSEKDLNYLRDTLVLSKSEEEALEHFRSKFDEALRNSWKTSMNWATHNLSKNNKA